MTKASEAELDSIIAALSEDAKRIIKGAIGDRFIGLWVGNGSAVWEVHLHNLTECEPSDGGGLWGEVAPLNDTGIAVMSRILKLQAN